MPAPRNPHTRTGKRDLVGSVHLALSVDTVGRKARADLLYQQARSLYDDALTEAIAEVGCSGQGHLAGGAELSALKKRAEWSAASIAKTYNKDLLTMVEAAEADWVEGHGSKKGMTRLWLAKTVRPAIQERDTWKEMQIGVTEQTWANDKARQDFFTRNGVDGRARIEPGIAVCPICQEAVRDGWLPVAEAFRRWSPPWHPSCPHNIVVEPLKESIPDCASLWRGQVKTGRKGEGIEALIDALTERVTEDKTQSTTEALIQALEYNPYHKPAGPGGGQFASKGGVGGGIVNPKDARAVKAAERQGWPEAFARIRNNEVHLYGQNSESAVVLWNEKGYHVEYVSNGRDTKAGPFGTAKEASGFAEGVIKAKMPKTWAGDVSVPHKTQSAKTDSDAKLTEQAIVNHALAKAEYGKVSVDKIHILKRVEPPGEGELVELWHGTTKAWGSEPVHEALGKGVGFKPSESGALGKGVYFAPGANKSLGYGNQEGNGNAMVRVLARPGKVLTLTPKVQQSAEKWGTEQNIYQQSDVKKLQRVRDKVAKQRDILLTQMSGDVDKPVGQRMPKEQWDKLLKRVTVMGVKTADAGERWNDAVAAASKKYVTAQEEGHFVMYAKSKGYDAIRYVPPRARNPIAALRQGKYKDTIGFQNEEWLIFNPIRVMALSVTYTKENKLRSH